MKNMMLGQIAKACGGEYFGTEEQKHIFVESVEIDSRKIGKGGLFIPIRGERVDGHDFIASVFEKGAAASLSEEKLDNPSGPYILVESCTQALKDIAEYYRSGLELKIVGITGSVGKTSTKEMIASVLAEKFNVLKTEGNLNNEIGMPLTILKIREEHTAAVIEMGISEFGEMHRLAKIARPDICVITNIGQAHLENLKTRDGILKAKTEMFDFLKPDGVIVLNGNDDKLSIVGEVKGVQPLRYFVADGTAEPSQQGYFVNAYDIVDSGLEGVRCKIGFSEAELEAVIPIPGIHNVYNACAGACVGKVLGLSLEQIQKGIASARTIAGRSHIIKTGGITIIDDCYNANPVSMKASLEVLSGAAGRKIAVLGDMGELGEDAKLLHSEVGAYAAEKKIDLVFCTGKLAERIAIAAALYSEVQHFDSKEELAEQLIQYLQDGDTVLVKASHFMDFPYVVAALEQHFAE